MIRKYQSIKLQINTWYREEKPHNNHETQGIQTKQSNQPLPHRDDCKARMDVHQNIEQLHNPTMVITINNEFTTTEPPPYHRKQPKPLGGLNAFCWFQIFALDSAVC